MSTASSRQQRHYKPYTNSQLATIFEPRAYLAFNRDADYFWGPLLALHLGARLGEIVTFARAGKFNSGWPKLRQDHTAAQVKRLR